MLTLVNDVIGSCALGEFRLQMIRKVVTREVTPSCAILDGLCGSREQTLTMHFHDVCSLIYTVDYTFQKDGQAVEGVRVTVQGVVPTISSVQEGDGGNLFCTANNSVGRDTVRNNLIG